MLPTSAADDFMNAGKVNPELLGKPMQENAACRIPGADLPHVGLGQFSVAVPLAVVVCSPVEVVLDVFFRGAPAQIGKAAVNLDAVQVPALHPFRTRADEHLKDQTVNGERPI